MGDRLIVRIALISRDELRADPPHVSKILFCLSTLDTMNQGLPGPWKRPMRGGTSLDSRPIV